MKFSICEGVQVKRAQELPGRWSGIFDVVTQEEPCALRIRRQHGMEGWWLETDSGFEEATCLQEAVCLSLEEELRKVTEATRLVQSFLEVLTA